MVHSIESPWTFLCRSGQYGENRPEPLIRNNERSVNLLLLIKIIKIHAAVYDFYLSSKTHYFLYGTLLLFKVNSG
jgi:hypothetical protein